MDHFIPNPTYDHVTITNRARAMRAEVMADAMHLARGWVARAWTNLTHRRMHQPA